MAKVEKLADVVMKLALHIKLLLTYIESFIEFKYWKPS